MAWAVVAGAAVGGGLGLIGSKRSVDKATETSNQQAQLLDQRERERFEEAKVQAEKLRVAGDESAAVALEEAAKAELGAQKFEALSNFYAQNADAQAALRQRLAENIYGRTQDAAKARQTAGQDAKKAIQGAAGNLMTQAGNTDARITGALNESRGLLDQGRAGINSALTQGNAYLDTAFGNINERFQPFMDSERRARGQLDVEMGLTPGEVNRGYRSSPAYSSVMDASRVAEREGLQTIDQAAGNSGSLYSGSRGAALADRTRQGSWERAGVEQGYFQNYMSMLQQMANPTSTNTVSGYESGIAGTKAGMAANAATQNAGLLDRSAGMGMDAAGRISDAYMSATGTGLNAEMAAQGIGLDTMRTGMEGSDLLQYVDPGTSGAGIALNGMDRGTAGSPYRMSAADTKLNTTGNAAGIITGNMPTGINSAGIVTNAANNAATANNAMLADLIGAGTNLYTAYMQKNSTVPTPANYVDGNTNPKYPYMA